MIQGMIACLALLLLCAAMGVLRRARWIDRAALVGFVLLGVATRPTLDRHRVELANAVTAAAHVQGLVRSSSARAADAARVSSNLTYGDYYVFSVTRYRGRVVGVGLFDQVFTLGPPAVTPSL